jgi:hypothetical protein
MATVTVYRFKAWDQVRGESIVSRRMATRKGIEMCKGEALPNTATEIDRAQLENGEEWTEVDFVP